MPKKEKKKNKLILFSLSTSLLFCNYGYAQSNKPTVFKNGISANASIINDSGVSQGTIGDVANKALGSVQQTDANQSNGYAKLDGNKNVTSPLLNNSRVGGSDTGTDISNALVNSTGTTDNVVNWLGKKVDVSGGTSTNQKLTTPTVSGGTYNGGVNVIGTGEMSFVPKGSPVAGSVGSVMRIITMGHAGVQNFGDNTECTSSAVAPSNGGNVCQYTWIEADANSGGAWDGSWVTQLDSGFNTSTYSSLIGEMDLNNLAGDYGEFSAANSIGLLLNGLGHMNTSAISIQTGNKKGGTTGTNGSLAIWYYGLHMGSNAIAQADIDSQSSAVYGVRMRGAHIFGASYADDNSTGGAIELGNLGQAQGIVGRSGTTDYAMLYMDTRGMIHIGNINQANLTSDGNIIPITDNTYSLGSPTQSWNNVNVHYVNSVPVIANGTPTIGSACTSGAQQFDSTKLYMCLADSKWHTMATATD